MPIVRTRIKAQKDRTPESTLELIRHFVDKYNNDLPKGYRYIFTKDFDSESLRSLWQQLFDELSQEEALQVLQIFPLAAIYFQFDVIEKWINTIEINGDLSLIEDLEFIASKLEEPFKIVIKETIRKSVDDYIINLIRKSCDSKFVSEFIESESATTSLDIFDFEVEIEIFKKYTDTDFSSNIAEAKAAIKPIIDQLILEIIESWGNGELHSQAENKESIYNSSRKVTLESLVAPYQEYTDTNFADKIDKANLDRELLDFHNFLPDFETSPLLYLEQIKAKFQYLKNNEEIVTAFSESIIKAYENLKERGEVINIVALLKGIKNIFPNHFSEYSAEVWLGILSYLNKLLHDALHDKSASKFETEFERDFNTLMSIFDDNRIGSLRQEIITAILDSGNLSVLTYAVNSDFKWLTADQALAKSLDVINAKSDLDLINIVLRESVTLLDKVKEHIVLRLLASFIGKPLDLSYEEGTSTYYTKEENVNLLTAIKRFFPNDTPMICQAWTDYIDSLSSNDIIELYHRQIISSLPCNIIASLIQDLSLEDTYRPLEQWYSAPSFKDQTLNDLFSEPNTDIFTPISAYLKSSILTRKNVYKIVWLVELLNFNKPTDLKFGEDKKWETDFNSKLQKLKSELIDPKIAVVLWGVYTLLGTTKVHLSEIYSWLPPYLQIRILKRMMMGIDEGKIQHTAQSLYEFLRNGSNKLCIPVEIVFSYLTLRELTPMANFTHKHMLQIVDSREDHNEWIGIRQFVDECHGRVQYDWRADSISNNSWQEHFYNGIMDSKGASISLFLSRKMINRNCVPQNYNNKYFDLVQQVIELNFAEVAYQKAVAQAGVTYEFPHEYIKEVVGLCREFNIHNSSLNFE